MTTTRPELSAQMEDKRRQAKREQDPVKRKRLWDEYGELIGECSAATRAKQGLPPKIEDPGQLDRIMSIFRQVELSDPEGLQRAREARRGKSAYDPD